MKIFNTVMVIMLALLLIPGLVLAEKLADQENKLLNRHDTASLLLSGFSAALATPDEFKNTRIFNLLGYSESEIALIGKITPRPASISVEFETPEANGEFSNIKIICSQVTYYNLTIATATFEFPDCRLDLESLNNGKIRFVRSKKIRLKTEVSEDDIIKVFDLFARARSLHDIKLKLKTDKARIDGWYRKGLLTVHFKIEGDVLLKDSKKVDFACDRLTLNRIPLPRNTARAIIAKINPVFDSTKTWLNLNIEKINILDGFVETIASIDRKKG
ncbi:MAG: hypothetical protein Kow0029_24140 [Candidatus Rifleibacteriota bacterium]